MKTITVKLYQFDELSDKAKEKARDWYRELEAQDFGSHGEIWEPAEAAAKLLGITFRTNEVKLMGGGTRSEPDIRYSGFWSQGDGASFVGSYAYRKGCGKAVRSEFGKDEKLWRIADGLTALQKKHGYRIEADVTQGGSYVHKYTMDINITAPISDTIYTDKEAVYKPLLGLMRDFAQWIYDCLEEEYEYRQSDEQVDEGIRANEYDFREDGRRSDG
jgi:hypothetical protein